MVTTDYEFKFPTQGEQESCYIERFRDLIFATSRAVAEIVQHDRHAR